MTATILSAMLLLTPATEPSPVIFPQQSIPLTFSHAVHVKRNIACDYCHEKAPESTDARDFLIPGEESCQDCHAIERDKPFKEVKPGKPPARCDACHPGWEGQGQPPRVSVPAPHLKFNHKIHISEAISCHQCHGDMKDVDLATRQQLPKMGLCLKCHVSGTKKAASRCSTCHLITPSGTMQIFFAEGKLAPSGVLRGDEHTPDFRRNHANVARNDEAYCLNCHRKDECLSCHNGVVKPFDIHGNDYVSIHPIEARRDTLKCQACHRLQTFCVGCHQRSGVALDVPGGVPTMNTSSPLRFHPPQWVDRQFYGTPNHHAWQAMRNIRSCASCHREQSCLKCHASIRPGPDGYTPFADPSVNPGLNPSYVGTDPHLPGWGGKCRALVSRNKRVCLKCHLATSPDLTCDNAR